MSSGMYTVLSFLAKKITLCKYDFCECGRSEVEKSYKKKHQKFKKNSKLKTVHTKDFRQTTVLKNLLLNKTKHINLFVL